ncbi:hypothetical protein PO124_04295 [Bacillus licheniformis]|nr:hypothetical protein [Bacillus licheniformis]
MPRTVSEVLGERCSPSRFRLFLIGDIIGNGSFDYLATSLGIRDYLSFTVDSPYDYEEQMKVYIHQIEEKKRKKKRQSVQSKNLEGRR